MHVRPLTRNELRVVHELAHQIWPVVYPEIISPAQINYMLDAMYTVDALTQQFDAGHVFLVAEENDKALGFAAYECNCETEGKAKLHKLYVLPECHGTGLGSFLLKTVQQKALSSGQNSLFLNVNKYNKAYDFYLAKGFRKTHEVVIDIGNGFVMDDYIMELSLQ